MRPEDRFEALAAADAQALESLADEILAGGVDVSVSAGPESVSAPVRVGAADSDGTTVVLGHVALTRCSVLVDGIRGDGLRVGYDLPGAVAAAICDAECERAGALSTQVYELCRAAQEAQARRRRAQADLVAMTRLEEP
ncbi:phosphonate C-P lyase system protein PhnG [Mycobacterium hubeiense]|uniref:phosphonate C-P lyase system protein PhnG n=1 Tax=Mycobacterium hubeiense TaxID=1867256 RepID=UPI000C7EC286|nr:phosphonate C-P lyase system protein PhnG [Mycobacterium sp. QGD 101]